MSCFNWGVVSASIGPGGMSSEGDSTSAILAMRRSIVPVSYVLLSYELFPVSSVLAPRPIYRRGGVSDQADVV